jgi:hypothetical protein
MRKNVTNDKSKTYAKNVTNDKSITYAKNEQTINLKHM